MKQNKKFKFENDSFYTLLFYLMNLNLNNNEIVVFSVLLVYTTKFLAKVSFIIRFVTVAFN